MKSTSLFSLYDLTRLMIDVGILRAPEEYDLPEPEEFQDVPNRFFPSTNKYPQVNLTDFILDNSITYEDKK